MAVSACTQVASPVPDIQHTPMPFGSPVPYPVHDTSPAAHGLVLPSQQQRPLVQGDGKGEAYETAESIPQSRFKLR